MDEKNNILPDDSEFLKSLEADHVANTQFDLPDFLDTDKTQVFKAADFRLPDETAPFEPVSIPDETPAPAAEVPAVQETAEPVETVSEEATEEAAPAEETAAENTLTPVRQRRSRQKKQTFSLTKYLENVEPQYFKEVLLPLGICALAAVFCLVFIIGSISHKVKSNKEIKESSIAASISLAEESKQIYEEYGTLLLKAEQAANSYDYETAVALLDSFSGSVEDYPDLLAARNKYADELSRLTAWNDPADVLNLSFHVLIADASRAFNDDDYGYSYEAQFITTEEFTKILNQLYENGYMLVDFDDIVQTITNSDGTVGYAAKTLYLPSGKRPLMLTETNANYYTYMVDGDGDGLADADGAGFACKLVLDATGNLTCQLIDANGNTVTGAFDMVPILEEFIEAHPDFSYRNARAIIASSGYDGILGYRINADAEETLGAAQYNMEVAQCKQVIQALKDKGYKIACYTYGNVDYDDETTADVQVDLHNWNEQIVPVIGSTDILVYARNSDISDTSDYSGDKYEVLKKAGFTYYLGVGSTSKWASLNKENVRQFRMTVTGEQLTDTPEKYSGIFDAESVLSEARYE